MKRQGTEKTGYRKSTWIVRPIVLFIACMVLIVLISLPLMPLVALAVILPRIIDSIGASFLESFSAFMATLTWVIELAAYSVWLLLIGDHARLITLLPELMGSLRSICLL